MGIRASLAVIVAALLAAACVPTRPAKDSLLDVARDRAAREFPACPAARITTKPRFDLTRESVEADACGEHVIYSCPITRHKMATQWSVQKTDIRDECYREGAGRTTSPEKG